MGQFDANYIQNELGEIGKRIRKPVKIYLIGGCALSFRGLKETTKDMDIVFRTDEEFEAFCDALFGAQYAPSILGNIIDEYGKLQAKRMFENKDGFHLDLFVGSVMGKMRLTSGIEERSGLYGKYGSLEVFLVSKEDVFLFKSLASASRKRDLDDMRALYPNLDWKVMGSELKKQGLEAGLRELMVERLEEFGKKYELDVPLLKELKKKVK